MLRTNIINDDNINEQNYHTSKYYGNRLSDIIMLKIISSQITMVKDNIIRPHNINKNVIIHINITVLYYYIS